MTSEDTSAASPAAQSPFMQAVNDGITTADGPGRAGTDECLLVLRMLHKYGPMKAEPLSSLTGLNREVLYAVLRGLKARGRVSTAGAGVATVWNTTNPFRAQRD